jgi:hypothetical protein
VSLAGKGERCRRHIFWIIAPLHILRASSERDLDAAFVTLVQLRAGALMITADGCSPTGVIKSLRWRDAIPPQPAGAGAPLDDDDDFED